MSQSRNPRPRIKCNIDERLHKLSSSGSESWVKSQVIISGVLNIWL